MGREADLRAPPRTCSREPGDGGRLRRCKNYRVSKRTGAGNAAGFVAPDMKQGRRLGKCMSSAEIIVSAEFCLRDGEQGRNDRWFGDGGFGDETWRELKASSARHFTKRSRDGYSQDLKAFLPIFPREKSWTANKQYIGGDGRCDEPEHGDGGSEKVLCSAHLPAHLRARTLASVRSWAVTRDISQKRQGANDDALPEKIDRPPT